MKLLLLAITLLTTLHLLGQTILTGRLIDTQTQLPIEYATVYISGTTYGTISNSNGQFSLDKYKVPCQLVVSHIGYYPQTVYLDNSTPFVLDFSLIPREIVVAEVDVSDKNLREENLAIFKEYFLGSDVWGKYSTIENEDALIFSRNYETINKHVDDKKLPPFTIYASDITFNEDSTIFSYKKATDFKAAANAPLRVNLPLLGYTITANLVKFNLSRCSSLNYDLSTILGYYYFQANPFESKRDSIRITKNRLKAYHNSSLQFCRSLFEHKLKQNGYEIYEEIYNEKTLKNYLKETNIDSCLVYKDNYAEIVGLKDKTLVVLYYQHADGTPVDLRKEKRKKALRSSLYFYDNTCIIRNDGSTPSNTMAFGGVIGNKKIGAIMPENFIPTGNE